MRTYFVRYRINKAGELPVEANLMSRGHAIIEGDAGAREAYSRLIDQVKDQTSEEFPDTKFFIDVVEFRLVEE